MSITSQQQCNEELLIKVAPVNRTTDTNNAADATDVGAKSISAFAYASTPAPLNLPRPKNDSGKWRHRLSMIKPSSFLKMNNNNNNTASNITTTTN
jgi:hypothetical protein